MRCKAAITACRLLPILQQSQRALGGLSRHREEVWRHLARANADRSGCGACFALGAVTGNMSEEKPALWPRTRALRCGSGAASLPWPLASPKRGAKASLISVARFHQGGEFFSLNCRVDKDGFRPCVFGAGGPRSLETDLARPRVADAAQPDGYLYGTICALIRTKPRSNGERLHGRARWDLLGGIWAVLGSPASR